MSAVEAPFQTKESLITFETSQGVHVQATPLKLSRFSAGFEVYGPIGILRASEALSDFRIVMQGQFIYDGRAVVNNVIHVGAIAVCEVTLEETCLELGAVCPLDGSASLQDAFSKFIQDWGRNYKIFQDFKVTMADMQSLFLDLRLWMEQMEMSVRAHPAGDRSKIERDVLEALQKSILPMPEPLLEQFETIARNVPPELQPAHRAYMKRQIHPVVLCSPFLYRTLQKPLGYAGDYEMVNMMTRDPFEGASMFAKMVNRIFLNTAPVLAHQARIGYLTDHLANETGRKAAAGKRALIYNLGCGPAREIQEFISRHDVSDYAEFSLLDFNEETLAYTGRVLGEAKTRHHRATVIQMIKRSVHQILKDAGKPSGTTKYDMVYCAGLFDYLSDQVCRKLMNFFYGLLAPGGFLLATNVSKSNPARNWMEYVLDWYLIYRDSEQMRALKPDAAPADNTRIVGIGDGTNIGLEVRKPAE